MQSHSILRNAPFADSVSNAVLTPEQIHPRYFLNKKSIPHMCRKNPAKITTQPLSEKEIAFRKTWANRQITFIKNLPSTAVLGA